MDSKYVDLEIRDGAGWIRFNRPEKLNAVNPAVLDQLEAAIAQCEAGDQVRVLVLRGDEKAFAAGADLDGLAKADVLGALEITEHTMRVQERLAEFPWPTVAALSGYALGAGCEIALCCDFRIAAENAVLGLPEINLGIIPGGGGTQRLPRLIGPGAAAELVLLGGTVKAQRAAELGLLHKLVPLGKLDEEVQSLVDKLLTKPALALRAAKVALRKGENMALKDGLKLEQSLFAMLFGTRDQKEGMGAFLEKRKPRFEGR